MPRWKTVEVKLVHLKDGKIQGYLIGDEEPYAFWTHVYQNFEMTSAHADKVRKRLTPGIHIIEVSKEEMEQIYPVINEALMIRNFPPVYYFLTEEGFNRSILEVQTGGMKNKEAAAKINARKDEMAAIFTRYKRGELIQPPIIDKITEKRNASTNLSKQVARVVNEKIVPLYRRRGENPHLAFSRENRAINEITAGEHETDMKNQLNSNGLDIQIATKISDLTLIKADVLHDETRWDKLKSVIDGLYPNREKEELKLTDREKALLKRSCSVDQTSLFEFKSESQLSGGNQ